VRRTGICLNFLLLFATLSLAATAHALWPENTRFKGNMRPRHYYQCVRTKNSEYALGPDCCDLQLVCGFRF
jgi:hypothetical protein